MKIFESLEVPKVQIELEAIFKAFQEVKKKTRLGKPVYEFDLLSRGDRIRTCDLVLPKHLTNKKSTSSIDYD